MDELAECPEDIAEVKDQANRGSDLVPVTN
jgi:hypothetical protein